jgi:hypothetical protein
MLDDVRYRRIWISEVHLTRRGEVETVRAVRKPPARRQTLDGRLQPECLSARQGASATLGDENAR